ncbi:hypothetical protein BABINDRAFT_160259 [Babjeviella inositovora NRRL Y-12698]|uniref:Uncharacterized protein n=1 Tax=Babjeviella inositovora NRRL Y-12698 TaxID=984486 RepID=A0A1E3QWP4_9ASCO|nr:uncharacterized protein BABINDRAFT_160259 [Babjeviella inositovora NRRL Y-12698]ODQ82061.1 hypothetical protein BABINDRAFT_160259 [Babjeviella inositovora NRRL Y-12698]
MSAKDQLIFAAINEGAHKQAQQLITKQLKKQPKSTYYLTLQAYAYLHGNKASEASSLADKIAAQTPSDPQTLEMLSIVFKSLKEYKKAMLVYENAAKKYPTMALITSWFSMNLDNMDARGMQKAAMYLAKLGGAKQRDYTCYAALCCYMAVELESGTTELEQKLFPSLGVRMMEKLQPFQNCQEVYIYAKLSKAAGQEAQLVVDAIQTFTGTNKLDLELQIILLETLALMESWKALYETAVRILYDYNLDDYNTWKHLITSGLKLDKSEIVRDLLGTYNGKGSRNTLLATIALHSELKQSLHAPVVAYYERFGSKPCGYPDLASFHADEIFASQQFIEYLEAQKPEVTDIDTLTWVVNHQRFKLLLRTSAFSTKKFINENFQYYEASKRLLQSKEKTDFYLGDELLLMNCALLLDEAEEGKFVESAAKCLVLLEAAAKADHHEPHLRIWLVKLYSFLSCSSLALKHYDVMNIKQMQLDLLSHHLLGRHSSTINFSDNLMLEKLEQLNKFYPQTAYEIQHFTNEAFEKGSYNKIVLMVDLGNKLVGSVNKMIAAVESIKLGKLLGNKALVRAGYTEAANIRSETVAKSDNRDFRTHWFFGTNQTNEKVRDRMAIGPKQTNVWCQLQLLKELLITETSEAKVKQLHKEMNLALARERASPELTAIEKWSVEIMVALSQYHTSKDVKLIDAVLSLMESPPPAPRGSELLTWKAVHHHMVVAELAKSVQLYLSVHSFPKKYTKVYELRDMCGNQLEALRDETVASVKQGQLQEFMVLESKVLDWGILVGYDAQLVLNGIRSSMEANVAVLRRI